MPITSQNVEELKKSLRNEIKLNRTEFFLPRSELDRVFYDYLAFRNFTESDSNQLSYLLLEGLVRSEAPESGSLIDWLFESQIFPNPELLEQIIFRDHARFAGCEAYQRNRAEVVNFVQKEQIKPFPKYINLPTSDRGNFILFSMVMNQSEIRKIIEKFPTQGDVLVMKDGQKYQRGRASTVAWSGVESCNVPTAPWRAMKYGMVIDPQKITTSYGDIVASYSLSAVPDESELRGNRSDHRTYVTKIKSDSKYEGKLVVDRMPYEAGYVLDVTTNQARIIKSHNGYYLSEEGSIEVFAANIWRKFFKRNYSGTNEVLCVQKGEENPLVGILLNTKPGNKWQDHMTRDFCEILRENPHFDLYIYDIRQREHIVRVVKNREAVEMLENNFDFSEDFVATLPAYRGFSQSHHPLSHVRLSELKPLKHEVKTHDLHK